MTTHIQIHALTLFIITELNKLKYLFTFLEVIIAIENITMYVEGLSPIDRWWYSTLSAHVYSYANLSVRLRKTVKSVFSVRNIARVSCKYSRLNHATSTHDTGPYRNIYPTDLFRPFQIYFGVWVTICVTASWVGATHCIKYLYLRRPKDVEANVDPVLVPHDTSDLNMTLVHSLYVSKYGL